MPRPKRSKVAPSAPAILPPKLAAALRAADDVAVDSSQKSSNSDESLGHVKRGATGRNRRGIARQEIYMSGALGDGDQQKSKREVKSKATERVALREVTRNVDLKKSQDARQQKKEGLKVRNEDVVVPSSIPDDDVASLSPQRPSTVRNTPSTAQKPIPQKQAMPSANWRAQATPRMDSSVLALGNFKRRSRQPSLLGIGRPDESPSFGDFELGGDISFDGDEAFAQSPAPAHVRQTTVAPDDTLISAAKEIKTLSSSARKRKRSPEILIHDSQSPSASEAGPTSPSPPILIDSQEDDDEDDEHDEDEPKLPPINHRAITPQILSDTMAPPESNSSSPSRAVPAKPATNLDPLKSFTAKPKTRAHKRNPKTNSKPLQPLSTADLQSLLPRRRSKRSKAKPHDAFDVPNSSSDHEHEPEMTEPSASDDELSFMPVPKTRAGAKGRQNDRKKAGALLGQSKTPARKTPAKAAFETPASASASKRSTLITTKSKNESSRGGKTLQPQPQSSAQKTYSRQDRASSSSSPLLSSPPASAHSNLHSVSDAESMLRQRKDKGASHFAEQGEGKGQRQKDKDSDRDTELKALARKFREVDEWEMEFEVVTASSSSPWDAR